MPCNGIFVFLFVSIISHFELQALLRQCTTSGRGMTRLLQHLEQNLELKQYLEGNLPWKGTKDILGRKGQIPSSRYGALDVVKICLSALQINDDPQLDHGCCVVQAFQSPKGEIAQLEMDPAAFGRVLRRKCKNLVDHTTVELISGPEFPRSDGLKAEVRIKTKGCAPNEAAEDYTFSLSKWGDLWLVDSIEPAV